MTAPTLFVTGSAERLVTPDRVVVSVSVQTPVLRTAPEALARAAEARRRVLDHAASLPGTAASDGRITTRQEQRTVEEERPGRTETRWEVAGDTGLCMIGVEGMHPGPPRSSPPSARTPTRSGSRRPSR
ncbi:MAG TPA: SIMPL domain-containing protein [Miltoncostaeaceae bacterium]|nr:SIMPL domain-containing protein [Miltoncostaeaceae bacterium]